MRSTAAFIATVIVATTASAQNTVVRPATPSARGGGPIGVSIEDVVARLQSLDVDKDGVLKRDELPERMHDLLTSGDSNQDGGLDVAEIRAMAGKRPRPAGDLRPISSTALAPVPRPLPQHGIEGAITDLKLPPEQEAAALAAYTKHQDDVAKGTVASVERLAAEVESLLRPEQLKAFLAVVTWRWPGARRLLTASEAAADPAAARGTVSFSGAEMDRTLDGFQLASDIRARITEALIAHLDRVVAVTVDDSSFRRRLQGILTGEEFGDFVAALDRRLFVNVSGGRIGGPPPPPPASSR